MLVDYQQNIRTERHLRRLKGPLISLLWRYPPDTVAVINGQPVTKSDILDAKRTRQARELENKLRSYDNIEKPCLIWTFNNGPVIPYGGWWLYVRTLKHDWCIRKRYNDIDLTLKIMALYPCGLLPIMENYHKWLREFARHYPKATAKRPRDQGMALARAVYEPGYRLIDVRSEDN